MIEIRSFEEKNFYQLLDLCNTFMEYDNFSETLLREKVIEEPEFKAELALTAWDKDKLVGFMFAVIHTIRSENIGFIKLMVVDKQYRRQGIANEMYKRIEKIFKDQGAETARIYDVPFNYYMPGIDPRYTAALAFAERNGFERYGDTANMTASLQDQDFSTEKEEAALEEEGITICRAGYDDVEEVMDFIKEHFALWVNEIKNTYNSIPVSLHIARLNGKVRAFSAHNGNNFGTGWFGPMGTHPDLRGKGIGSILLKRCLQDMKDWGLEKTIIPWVGPYLFYSHYVNANIDRVFWRYKKKLK